ncbi:MAG: TIGR01620 family protein, partial [Pseudomonadota bacterium]
AENNWLGWTALGATAALLLAIIVFVVREIASIWRLRSTSDLRSSIEASLKSKNSRDINKLTRQLETHFQDQPMTAHGRATLAENRDEVMDAQDRYALAERELLSGLDAEAQKIVANAAKRVSVVTAVSPRAIVDVGYVLYENVRLIRILCELYGGRAGFVGTMSLARSVVAHLAVTGTIAAGEGIIQQLLGHGLAAKLSARLGEGVVNGVMTARIGLAAIDVCRPAPFHALEKPKLSNFISMLTKLGGDKKTATNNPD